MKNVCCIMLFVATLAINPLVKMPNWFSGTFNLPARHHGENFGADDVVCTHAQNDRDTSDCAWADGSPCSQGGHIYVYNDDSAKPDSILEDYVYCGKSYGKKCVDTRGHRCSADPCVNNLHVADVEPLGELDFQF